MRDVICEKIKAIKPSGIRKLFDIANEIPDVISLGVGEPDFDTPWHIREEGMYSLQQGKTFYTSNAGLAELREEICSYIKRKYHLTYDSKSEVIVTVGGSEAIDIALRTILNPGDEVICPEPCFVSYQPCIALADGVPVTVSLTADTEFRLTKEQLEAAITPKSKALMISYPNNPTGAMTGWRLGYVLAPAGITQYMLKIHQFAIMSSPTTSQYAAIAALRYGDKDIQTMKESYNQRRRYLMDSFRKLELPCFEPFGAFYVFPEIAEFGMSSEDFCTALLKAENVAVVPGSAFGECGDKHVRISYAYSLDELREAMKRITRFVKKLRAERKRRKQ